MSDKVKVFHRQTLASTHVDRHGEKYPRKMLDDICKAMPPQMPLGIQHEPALGSTDAWIENSQVVEDPESPGEYLLIGDVVCPSGRLPTGLNGWSFVATKQVWKKGTPEVAVYLPWPHYADEEVVERLLGNEVDIAFGKLIRKSINGIALVALIVGILNFRLKKDGGTLWTEVVTPTAKAVYKRVEALRRLESEGMRIDYHHVYEYPDGTICRVEFITSKDGKFTELRVPLEEAMASNGTRLEGMSRNAVRPVRVVVVHDAAKGGYRILEERMCDGQTVRH